MATTQSTYRLSPARIACAMLVALFAICGLGLAHKQVAYAETGAELQQKAEEAWAELQERQSDLDAKYLVYYSAVQEKEAAQAAMDEAQGRLDVANEKIADVKSRIANRARVSYRSGNSTFIDLLFGSTSFASFVSNLDMLSRLNESDTELVNQTKELKAQIEEEKAEYANQKAIAEDKEAVAQQAMLEAQAMVEEMEALYNNLSEEARVKLAEEAAAEAARIAAEQAAQRAAEEAARLEAEKRLAEERASQNDGTDYYSVDYYYQKYPDNDIVIRALSWVGKAEYVWGACYPGGFDCSGFVAYCVTGRYARNGTTWTYYFNINGLWPRVSDPQPGDIAVIHTDSRQHTGVYLGDGMMAHAADFGIGVIIGPVSSGMVFVRYMGY